jgi:hypothetical protein
MFSVGDGGFTLSVIVGDALDSMSALSCIAGFIRQ